MVDAHARIVARLPQLPRHLREHRFARHRHGVSREPGAQRVGAPVLGKVIAQRKRRSGPRRHAVEPGQLVEKLRGRCRMAREAGGGLLPSRESRVEER